MMWAVHPSFHQALGVKAARGDIFAGSAVGITLGLDPSDRTRAVAPFVDHLFVRSHVLGVPLGGGCQFGANRQGRQLGLGSQAVMSPDDLVARGFGVEISRGLIARCLKQKGIGA